MSISSELKKEGIEVIKQLSGQKVNMIAKNIASKLCLAFPEHNLNRAALAESISYLNMYIAKMPLDSSGAKYFYKDNSIYFNEDVNFEDLSVFAMHECIHFIQELRDSNNKLIKMGFYNPHTHLGVGLNEAAVQLMACEANMSDATSETYFNININTISPDCYPLECTLVNEIAYFTGTYPLYHSALNSNDVFKNTFIVKTNKKTYSTVMRNLDRLMELENDLNYFALELKYADKISTIKLLNKLIKKDKENIASIFFKTQDLIIEKFFKSEFNSIRNMDDIKTFNSKLYDFQNVLGYSDGYTFYNEFYRAMMNMVQEKKSYIEQYGELNLFENLNTSLMIVNNANYLVSFFTTFASKIKKLFKLNRQKQEDMQ